MKIRLPVVAALAALAARYLLRRWPRVCGRGAVNFEHPTPGGTFALGTPYLVPATQIYNSGDGLAVVITHMTDLTGLQHFQSGKIVNAPPHPFGNGQMIHLNNAVLSFDLKQNTRRAEFEYLAKGGIINLGARSSSNMWVGSMYAMPASMVVNGVTITRSNVTDFLNSAGAKVGERGRIRLAYSGDIGGMIIGGQEIYLDNFCFN
jgi:hypothetical protein